MNFLTTPQLEKKLIESVNENNLDDVKILLKGANNDTEVLGPALLMATSMGYSDIVEELLWIKDNKGHKIGIHKGITSTDIISALNTAKINRENASDKKIWIDIIYNLSWILVQILEDRHR